MPSLVGAGCRPEIRPGSGRKPTEERRGYRVKKTELHVVESFRAPFFVGARGMG